MIAPIFDRECDVIARILKRSGLALAADSAANALATVPGFAPETPDQKASKRGDLDKSVKVVTSLLPKELVFSDSTVADLSDEQIDTLIMTLRRQVLGLAAQQDEALN